MGEDLHHDPGILKRREQAHPIPADRKKSVLTLATLPLLIAKNGIRIVTLSLLSVYVDPRFLTGSLHRDGGILFFLLALVLVAPFLLLLQVLDRTRSAISYPVTP